jgi:hypothetical protein
MTLLDWTAVKIDLPDVVISGLRLGKTQVDARFICHGLRQQEGLLLVGVSGLSYEVAATVCHCSVGTMKSPVSRARRDLKQLLADDLCSRLV